MDQAATADQAHPYLPGDCHTLLQTAAVSVTSSLMTLFDMDETVSNRVLVIVRMACLFLIYLKNKSKAAQCSALGMVWILPWLGVLPETVSNLMVVSWPVLTTR